jgi:hypothetical protein
MLIKHRVCVHQDLTRTLMDYVFKTVSFLKFIVIVIWAVFVKVDGKETRKEDVKLAAKLMKS